MLHEFSEVRGFNLGSKNMNQVLEEGKNNGNPYGMTKNGMSAEVGSEAIGVVNVTQSEEPACPDYRLHVRNSKKDRLAKTKITFIRLSCCTTNRRGKTIADL